MLKGKAEVTSGEKTVMMPRSLGIYRVSKKTGCFSQKSKINTRNCDLWLKVKV